jgi:tetratricopeptide (TPR) repeat protein/O-antigen ligase
MNTQLRAWCLGALEAATLLALATVPLFVNFYGFRVFDLGKAAIFVSLALVMVVAAIVAVLEARAGGWRAAVQQPLVIAALLLWLATAVATVFSVVPRLSFIGSSERAQGLVFLTAALVLFGAVAWAAREPARSARIVAVLVAGSVPVAVFALLQSAGVEVVPGKVESALRVFGTLSNPMFLGAYLMLVLPLSVARLITSLRERRSVVAIGYGVVGLLQVAALSATVSRGAFGGLAAGIVVFALAWSGAGGRRWVGWSGAALAVAGLAFVGTLNVPGGPLEPLKVVPILERVGQIGETATGSQAARLRIWTAVDELLAQEPGRLVLGHGPESLKYALLPYAGPNIGGRGQADRLVDRAHNVLLDALVMTGVPGALALLLVYGAWLVAAAATLGLTRERRDRWLLGALLVGGTVVGALACLVPHLAPAAGALALLGMVAGLVVFLIFAHLRQRPSGPPDPLGVALLAAGAAAVAEAAFGIQTVVTQVVFWALAGLVVAARLQERATEARPGAPALRPHADRAERREAGTVTLTWSAAGATLGLVTGAAMGLVVYDFVLYGVARLPATLGVAFLLALVAWVAGLLATADVGESLTAAGVTSVVVAGGYVLVRAMLMAATGDPAVLFTTTVLGLVGLAVLGGWLLRPRTIHAPAVSGPTVVAYPLLGVVAVAVLYVLAVRPVQADTYFEAAAVDFDAAVQADDSTRFQAAEALFARAVAANPHEDVYHLEWGERYMLIGGASKDVQTAAPWFERAQAQVAEAERLDPKMPYHTFNRGHLQLVFAQMASDEQRVSVAANAEVALQQAFDQVPSDPQVANELALAKLLKGDGAGAVGLLEYVRDQLDPENSMTWQLLGRAYAAAGRTDDAKAATEHALTMGAATAEDLVSLGDLARQSGDLNGAVQYYERAVGKGVDNWAVWFNLGLLYRDLGRTDEAMNALSTAMQRAPEEEASRVQAAIEALLQKQMGLPAATDTP